LKTVRASSGACVLQQSPETLNYRKENEMQNRNLGRVLALPTGAALALGMGNAMATGPDYGSILTGVDGSAAVTAFVAAAAILALVGFGKWISKKIGRFFG
jgi:hypothetical protein